MYNKVFLIGNLTRDPEVRYTGAGIAVARFGMAINRIKGKNSEGDAGDVDFINIVAWRRLAEICKEYLKKGSPIAIEGRLQINNYEKDGEKKSFAEVVADNMQMLGKKTNSSYDEDGNSKTNEGFKEKKSIDEEVPF